MSFLGMRESIDPMKGFGNGAAFPTLRSLIVSTSSQPAIPRRVALQQSPPPLHRPPTSMREEDLTCKRLPANGNLSLISVSHQDRALQYSNTISGSRKWYLSILSRVFPTGG